MNNPEKLKNISQTANAIFYISALVIFISLLPVLYGLSNGSLLVGTAGIEANPNNPTSESSNLSYINTIIAAVAGIVGSGSLVVSAIAAIRRARLDVVAEELKFKTAQLQYEMQMKEIEILKIELEKEKYEKGKKNKK